MTIPNNDFTIVCFNSIEDGKQMVEYMCTGCFSCIKFEEGAEVNLEEWKRVHGMYCNGNGEVLTTV